jgi:(R,R)-butanediol dehydrogenase / meso-butanediol dehydrogenase / diacetyl reductase
MTRALMLVEAGGFDWRELPDPTPGPGEVVVQAGHMGLCGTDLHIIDGSHPRARFPLALGHEFVGAPRSGPLAGQTVLVDPLLPCGRCAACELGASNACANLRLIGIDRDGALAGQVVVAADRLHPVPPSIPDEVAPLAEPLAVAVHTVRRVPPLLGQQAVVVGGGPVGLLVAHVARRAGALVRVAETSPPRRTVAEAMGLELLDPAAPVEGVMRVTGGRLASVVFDAAAAAPVAAMLTQMVRPGGTIAIVGTYGRPTAIDLQAVMFKELSIVGHRTYQPADIDTAIAILSADLGVLRPLLSGTVSPDQVPATIDALRAGQGMKYVVDCRG